MNDLLNIHFVTSQKLELKCTVSVSLSTVQCVSCRSPERPPQSTRAVVCGMTQVYLLQSLYRHLQEYLWVRKMIQRAFRPHARKILVRPLLYANEYVKSQLCTFRAL